MRFAWILVSLLFSFSSFCQHYIKGQVRDDKGNGLADLRLLVKSNHLSVTTGRDGYFGFPATKANDTLIVYFNTKDSVIKFIKESDYNIVLIPADKIIVQKQFKKLSSVTRNFKFTSDQFYSNESYSSTMENGFVDAFKFPSTEVSLNYNRASYSNVRRFLNNNTAVPPDAVRLGEMLNYFSWNYTEPDPGKTFRINSALTSCPWNKEHQLLFLDIFSKKLDLRNLPPSHLVFLIDISGSMNLPNRLPLLKSAFRTLVNNLRDKDTVSIVAYGGSTSVLLNGISGSNKEKITNVIDSLQPRGSTPGESGIRLAYRIARAHFVKGGNNRVILATDGDFNVGVRSEDELEQLIVKEKETGVYLTCLGVGMGDYKDSKIQVLAQKGNGNFAYLDSYAETEKVLFKEFFQTLYTVADDVAMNIRFNPQYVDQYRLIGYDNKLSSLRDKTAIIEGGEVGAGNSLLVAFEVNPKQNTVVQDSLATIDISYLDKGIRSDYHYVAAPKPEDITKADSSYRLASAVIMFGMKVKKSSFARNIKWETVLNTAKSSVSAASFTEQEFLQLIHAAKLVYRKDRKKFLFF